MSRVDKPALKCDRCGVVTENLQVMGSFKKITYSHMSGREEWDLCSQCWLFFQLFMREGRAEDDSRTGN
jgi:hypothetical protein